MMGNSLLLHTACYVRWIPNIDMPCIPKHMLMGGNGDSRAGTTTFTCRHVVHGFRGRLQPASTGLPIPSIRRETMNLTTVHHGELTPDCDSVHACNGRGCDIIKSRLRMRQSTGKNCFKKQVFEQREIKTLKGNKQRSTSGTLCRIRNQREKKRSNWSPTRNSKSTR